MARRRRKEIYNIYSDEGKRIGYVKGEVFYKSIHGNIHFLISPSAIANDVSALHAAERYGAKKIQVKDLDTGQVYVTDIRLFWDKGIRIDRGHSIQIALPFPNWRKRSETRRQYRLTI